jgi:hypothetical protein
MKKLIILAIGVNAIIAATLTTALVMMFNIIPADLTPVVAIFLAIRVAIPVFVVSLVLYALWLALDSYLKMPGAERSAIDAAVCPAIDLGLHRARSRTDVWGKAAKLFQSYRRLARRYRKSQENTRQV